MKKLLLLFLLFSNIAYAGDITEQNLGNATFNWNLPATIGTPGYFLTAPVDANSSMTWTAPAGGGTVTSITGSAWIKFSTNPCIATCTATIPFNAAFVYSTYGGL